MFRYLCPAAISKTHSCPHFLMKPLTIGLLTGFIVGGCIGVLAWAFLQNLFAISICAGIGMLIGIVIGTLIDYEKNNHQEK